MYVVVGYVIEHIYERTVVGVTLDLWEKDCGSQVAQAFDQPHPFEPGAPWAIPIEVFLDKKEELGLIEVARLNNDGHFVIYRRPVDMERLILYATSEESDEDEESEEGEKFQLSPEEWS